MKPVLRWDPNVPKEVRGAAEWIVKSWVALLAPRWLTHVLVTWDTEKDPSDSMSAWGRPEYGFGTVRIHPGWLDQTPEKRQEDVVHELVHMLLAPQHHALIEIQEQLVPEAMKVYVREQWRLALETSVVDTTRALLRARNGR